MKRNQPQTNHETAYGGSVVVQGALDTAVDRLELRRRGRLTRIACASRNGEDPVQLLNETRSFDSILSEGAFETRLSGYVVRILKANSFQIGACELLTRSLSHPSFFRLMALLSKSDCAIFHCGWFHATGSNRGRAASPTQSRQNNSIPRPPRTLPTMLGEDALSEGRWGNGEMVASALCLVLYKMPGNQDRRIDRARRTDLGHSHERRGPKENRQFPILRHSRKEGWEKEVSPEANHRAYLECVLSDRATREPMSA